MIALILAGVTMMLSGAGVDSGVTAGRTFLMLNDKTVEFVDKAPVVGRLPVVHKWDPERKRSSEVVDGIEFAMGKPFWKMVKKNEARSSVMSAVRIEKDGRLFYRDKPVELGFGVGHLETVLRWDGRVVAVGTAADKAQSTIKGPTWYLFWFGEQSLKGSYREASTVGPPTLRIYSQ